MAGGPEGFQGYIAYKRAQWSKDAVNAGYTNVGSYLQHRGVQSLADEFRKDDQFWSANICEFLSAPQGRDGTQLISQVGGYWDPDLGIAASVILGGLQLACASPKTESLAAPLAIAGGIAILTLVIVALARGDR